MKRLTIIVEDDADLSQLLAGAASVAKDLRVESVVCEKKHVKKKHVPGQSTHSAVMSHFTMNGKFLGTHADEWAGKAGFNPNSGSSCLASLERDGYIRRVGRVGRVIQWQFLKPYKKEVSS